jgi:hypothetical protein
LHQIPKKDVHLQYAEWAKRCTKLLADASPEQMVRELMLNLDGPIFSLQRGSETVIVLASGEMIKRLVDKRSRNYADRPAIFMQSVFEHSRIIMRGYDDLCEF